MIKELKGVKLKKLGFDIQKQGDLLYFEGPFISHFKDERGNDYLMKWVDVDEDKNRWLLVSVDKENLNKYFSGELNLLDIIMNNDSGAVYFLDIDDNANYLNIELTETSDIPNDYLPLQESYFEPGFADKYAMGLVKEYAGISQQDTDAIKLGMKRINKTNERFHKLSTFKGFGLTSEQMMGFAYSK